MSKVPEATEVRQYASTFEFRAVDVENRSMIAQVVPYGVMADLGRFTETIRKGAFSKSVRESARSLPLHLNHHHEEIPVGKAVTWHETDEWLMAEFEFDVRSEAKEAARLAEAGYLSGISIGFAPIRTDWDASGDRPHANRIEARALEVSLCSVPVYEGARVLALRSAGAPEIPETKIVPTPNLQMARAWLETIRQR